MKIDEITKITGKTRKQIQDVLNKRDFIEVKLTEKEVFGFNY
jgi:hypothetical protein